MGRNHILGAKKGCQILPFEDLVLGLVIKTPGAMIAYSTIRRHKSNDNELKRMLDIAYVRPTTNRSTEPISSIPILPLLRYVMWQP